MNPLKRWLDAVTDGNAALPLVLLFLLNLVDEFDQVLYGVVAPEIESTFGISEQAVITIASVSGALVIMCSVFMGVLADRHDRVKLTRGAALLWMVMSMLTGVAGFLVVLPLLIAARIGSGLGRVMNEPVHASLLADYYPTHTHGKVFSFHRQGNPIGLILALGGGLLADIIGWRTTFIVLAIPTLVVIAFVAKLPHPPRGGQIDMDLALAAEAKAHKIPLGEGWRRLSAIPTLKRTWWAAFFLGAAVVPITSFISFFFENVYDITTNFGRSAILTFFGFGSIIGINLGARYATKALAGLDLPKLSVYGGRSLIAGAACLVGMALSPWIGLSMVFLFLVGVVSVGFTSYNLPLVAAITPPRLRSQAFAYFVFFFGLGAIVIAGFASGIAEDYGYRQGLAILAFFEALAGLVYMSSKRFSMKDAEIAFTTLTAEVALNAESMGGDSDAILTCRKVEVAYDRVQVLFGVDLDVRRGECVALLGTNGAGKSTVLNAISGIVDPIGGAIFFEGRDITHLSTADTAELGIVVVPGGKAVFPTLSVAEHLRAASWLFRGDTDRVAAKVEEVYETFPRLRERIDQPAGNLSGGEQQMLALGMAFIAEPKLLIIDELSLGLAPTIVEMLLGIVRRIQASGTAIVLVEQSINVALTVADRAYFLEKGEVRFEGPTAELLERDDIVRSVFLAGASEEQADHEPGSASAPAPVAVRTAPPADAPVVLELAGVTKRFGGITAVDDTSFQLRQGEILGLIGSNGAGKTTIFDIISGFLIPEEGRVTFDGIDITELRPDQRAWLGLGRSFQDARLVPSLTVAENLALSVERHMDVRDYLAPFLGLPGQRSIEAHVAWTVQDLIELMSLGAFRDKFVRELSTGSRRVADLAMCIAHDPKVLLLDEPAAGIAQKEAEALGPLLERIQRETGCALMLIEHDMPLITGVSDRMIALELGHPVAAGTPEEVITNPRVVASYLGTDEATINRSSSGPRVDGAVIDPTMVLEQLGAPVAAGAPAPARRRREPLVAAPREDA